MFFSGGRAPRAMRRAWDAAGDRLGMVRHPETNSLPETMAGEVGGLPIVISYVEGSTQMRMDTRFAIETPLLSPWDDLNREQTMALLDARRGPRLVSARPLTPEETSWLRGHRLGIGVTIHRGCAVYQQPYSLEDPALIEFLVWALVHFHLRIALA